MPKHTTHNPIAAVPAYALILPTLELRTLKLRRCLLLYQLEDGFVSLGVRHIAAESATQHSEHDDTEGRHDL
jgi:hypothetical protein